MDVRKIEIKNEDLYFISKAVGPRGQKRAIRVKTSSNHKTVGEKQKEIEYQSENQRQDPE